MQGMFDRKKPDGAAVGIVKVWVKEHFALPENAMLSVSELYCNEPECPPVETVITVRGADGSAKNWRIEKAVNDIKPADIQCLRI